MYGVRQTWQDLPAHVGDWVGQVLGGPVVSAVSQRGGFSPGPADRVVSAAGRRAFVKAVSAEPNPDAAGLHRREAEVLRTLADVPSVPALIDAYDDGDWVVLVIEDVEADVLGTLAGLGGFFVDASRRSPPPGLPTLRDFQAAQGRACLTLLGELRIV